MPPRSEARPICRACCLGRPARERAVLPPEELHAATGSTAVTCATGQESAPAAKKAKVETAAPVATNTAKPATPAKKETKKKEEFSWEKKAPDPKDFMFSNLKGQVACREAPFECQRLARCRARSQRPEGAVVVQPA
jgi:hypothetical protein